MAISNGMGIKELKKIAESVGGIVIFDGDEPSLIVLPFDKYQAQISGGAKLTSEDIAQSVVSNFKPVLAGSSYEGGSQYFNGNDNNKEEVVNQDDQGLVEQLNQEIEALKDEIRMREAEELD